MKLAIIGGRDFKNYDRMKECYSAIPNITEIVSGGAKGADSMGEMIAFDYDLKFTCFKPDWETHGKAAGFIRNRLIIEHADVVLAFWDGKSKGTENFISIANKLEKPICVVSYE